MLIGIHGYTGNGYDDGVYLGAATRLVHGVLPYRDFDFVQPPGITLVMGPVALIGRLIGTRDAMAVARCFTAAVTGLNAALAALAVRDRGRTAMLVAGVSLALFPLAVAADQSLLLEPYLVCAEPFRSYCPVQRRPTGEFAAESFWPASSSGLLGRSSCGRCSRLQPPFCVAFQNGDAASFP